jgi:hypothetical protein
VSGPRRFSQAISEGDGISLIAQVDEPTAAARVEADGAEAVLVPRGGEARLAEIRDATSLPIVCHWGGRGDQLVGADACLLDARGDGDRESFEGVQRELGDSLELALWIEDEDQLETALEELDPEIFVLAAGDARGEEALEQVLDLLPDVPAGKLAIAAVGTADLDDVGALERAGFDGVIVDAGSVAGAAGEPPPEV